MDYLRKTAIFISFCLSVSYSTRLCAQQFNGFMNSDFSGVIGVRDQPASVANSPYKFDFNLLNANFYIGNNIAYTAKNEQGGTGLIRFNDFERKYLQSNFSVGGLSALFSLSKNRGIALQYRYRAMGNGTDISPNLVSQINRFANPAFADISYFNETMNFSVATWHEVAITYGGILKDDGFNRWKFGITLKGINPTGHAWLDLADADYSINDIGIARVTNFDLSAGYSSNLDNYEYFDGTDAMDIPPQGTGFSLAAGDIGLVYERVAYRPDPKTSAGTSLKPDITYEFRVSASITDIGVMEYERGLASFLTNGLSANAANTNFDVLLDSLSSFRGLRDSLSTFLNTSDANGAYTVSLPTAFRFNYDYNFGNNFFINASVIADLSWLMPTDYRVSYANSITITPRYETGIYGAYLPIFYNFLGDTDVGLAGRYGPLTLGTHSLGTLFAKEKSAMGFFFSLSLNLLKANADKPYCFGSSKTGSAFVRKERTPLYKRKKFIFF